MTLDGAAAANGLRFIFLGSLALGVWALRLVWVSQVGWGGLVESGPWLERLRMLE